MLPACHSKIRPLLSLSAVAGHVLSPVNVENRRLAFLVRHPQALTWHTRRLSSSPTRFYTLDKNKTTATGIQSRISRNIVYHGTLARTFRSLKMFSLSSLGLAGALTPFMFIIETSLPFIARVVLASTALGTSTVSTALVGWCGSPYVATIRALSDEDEANSSESANVDAIHGIQLETLTLTLRPRYTNVYDRAFVVETKRPFAKWELAEEVALQKSNEVGFDTPAEETVAETMDAHGNVLGRWIVTWSEDGCRGTCRSEGKIQKFFNVHEEILPPWIR